MAGRVGVDLPAFVRVEVRGRQERPETLPARADRRMLLGGWAPSLDRRSGGVAMRVAVTGGTGFVGSHSVSALVEQGHEVTLLARDRGRTVRALAPLGVASDRFDVVLGDVLEPASVAEALVGADALLHAANVYSLNAGDAATMHRVNVDGTRAVLTAAAERGLAPIVHVSSCVALLPNDRLDPSAPLGEPHGPYGRSKARAEAIARELQAEGAPVVITNPGSVYGPHQPHMGESATLVRDILRGKARLAIRGGLGVVDARDVATAHARVFATGAPQRCLLAGRWIEFDALYRQLERVVGHRLPRIRIPGRAAFAAGRTAEAAQRRGIDPGFSSESIWIVLQWRPHDDEHTRQALGVEWRPTDETLRDMVAWLHEQGHVSRRQAGLAADASWLKDGPATATPA
jgi:dihydroflavonol-4-reductase